MSDLINNNVSNELYSEVDYQTHMNTYPCMTGHCLALEKHIQCIFNQSDMGEISY